MKKALISPLEPREEGYRVAEVAETAFEVATPFIWVDCQDDIVADKFWYDPADSQIKPIPEQIPEQPTVSGAQTL